MNLDEAKAECERWFADIQREKDKSLALQKLAAQRRAGEITDDEAQRKLRSIQGAGIRVYDGANLERAVRVLLKHVKE